jgi:hypothetical protein
MTYILIALVASSFIFEYWLLAKINELNKENKIYRKSIQMALEALGRDINNFQAGMSRDLHSTKKELDITSKRIDKKVDISRRDIMNSLPTQIRKTIGHIEFSQKA